MIDALLIGLLVMPPINWFVFLVLVRVRTDGYSRVLWDMRYRSLGIAVLSTVYAGLVLSEAAHLDLSRDVVVFLLVFPVYLFTIINGVFLYLNFRRRW